MKYIMNFGTLYKVVPALLFFPLILISCESDESDGADVLIPLKIGNSWRRELIAFTVDGTVYESRTYYETIVDTVTIDSQLWFVDLFDNHYCDRDGDIWYREEGLGDYLLFKYPASEGSHYQTARDNLRVRVVDADTSINVQAGTFKCMRYDITQLQSYPYGWTDSYFISPTVGIVRTVLRMADNRGGYIDWVRTSLIDFTTQND